MSVSRCRTLAAPFALMLALMLALGSISSCSRPDSIQIVSVSLKNTESYQYATVSGDEDGARIAAQARHYSLSEIRRNAATNFVATYVYQPLPGFVGSDYSEIEVATGSDGASQPTSITKIGFRIRVHE